MTANALSFLQGQNSEPDDLARGNALIELATVLFCLPSRGTGSEPSEEFVNFTATLALWARRLRMFTPEQVKAGCDLAAVEWEYKGMPPLGFVASCIRKAGGIPKDSSMPSPLDAEAESAWQTLVHKIRTCGIYGDPCLDPHSESAVKSLGGWGAVCRWRADEGLDFKAKEFKRAYVLHKTYPSIDHGPQAVAALHGGSSAIAIEDQKGILQ